MDVIQLKHVPYLGHTMPNGFIGISVGFKVQQQMSCNFGIMRRVVVPCCCWQLHAYALASSQRGLPGSITLLSHYKPHLDCTVAMITTLQFHGLQSIGCLVSHDFSDGASLPCLYTLPMRVPSYVPTWLFMVLHCFRVQCMARVTTRCRGAGHRLGYGRRGACVRFIPCLGDMMLQTTMYTQLATWCECRSTLGTIRFHYCMCACSLRGMS